MAQSIAGVALAAGAGTRMAPITHAVAKPLCPVATVSLLDHALAQLRSVTDSIAINVHHHAEQVRAHVGRDVHVSWEVEQALGTAGALAHLRDWIDGRAVVVVNGDTWSPGSMSALLAGWDGDTVRLFVPGGGALTPTSRIAGSLMPWRTIRDLAVEPTGLYEVIWRDENAAGRLETVRHDGPWVDCATPADLLRANLMALMAGSVIDPSASVSGALHNSAVSAGAVVHGTVTDSVIFPGARVAADEHLVSAIRWVDTDGFQQTLDGLSSSV